MVQITIELDTSPIAKLGSMPREAIPKALSYAAQDMTRFLQMNSPVDHGLLKQWFIESLTDDEAHIKSPAEYAIYQDQGTRPHLIESKRRNGYLYWEGADHPVKTVHHPGFPGKHFVDQSFGQLQPLVPGYFLRALEEVQG